MAKAESTFRGSERFRVVGRLGSGASGEVFEAVNAASQARVALKALRRVSPELLRLFKHEFRAMQDIRHENLASLGELFEEDGQWFFTMELVEGGIDFLAYVSRKESRASDPYESHISLRGASAQKIPGDRAAADGTRPPFDEQRLRDALKQLVAGIRALHAAGRVHRDVKPSNVLVTGTGRVVIVDFGITLDRRDRQIDNGGGFTGTPVYMSPEQALSGEIGPASDWYAVGVVLYRALTGKLPFEGLLAELLAQKLTRPPQAPRELVPGIPHDLNDLCVALLQIEANERPNGAEIARHVGLRGSDAPSGNLEQVFVGRQRELLALREAFDVVRSGASVVVFVEGESGVGKTEIVRRFVDELEESAPDTLVLRGRSYERESIPYEALDDALDDLSRTLRRPEWDPRQALAALSPYDFTILGRTFPVLRDILADPGASMQEEMPSPREQRVRLFEAMRSMLGCLARRSPLVLWIDDLHWADSDSIALLSELLRAPGEPPMMLLCTLRSETAVRAKVRDVTREIVKSASRTKTMTIGKLPLADAEALARLLLKMRGANDTESSAESLRGMMTEAQGHPLFIDELVRQRGTEGETRGVQLDEVLWRRVRALKPDARRMLELVAVVGMPVPQEIVVRAGTIRRESVAELVRDLQHTRMIRTSGERGQPLLAPYHDRIRESVVARLDEDSLRALHAQLAVAGEQEKDCDPEFLLTHWDGAGNAKRAGEYARTAADRAASALAFDHAALHYRRAIVSGAFDGAGEGALRARLADVLTAAGREAEAAEVRLELAREGTMTEALDLRRQAAEQFLMSGHFGRGKELLREVLSALHERFPESPMATIFWLLFVRLQLWLRGLRFPERDPAALDRLELVHMDALFSAGAGFAMTDNVRGAYFQTKNLLRAMKAGDVRRTARGLALEATFRAAGGTKAARTTLAHLAVARSLAERAEMPDALGLADMAEGYAFYVFGDWSHSISSLLRAEATFRDRCVGVYYNHYQINSTCMFLYRALTYAGRFEELRQRHGAVLLDAVQRGDRYTVLNMKCTAAFWVAVADDRPRDARRLLDDANDDLPAGAFLVQHYFHLLAGIQLDLYCGGDAGAAYARLVAAAPSIHRSFLSRAVAFEVQRRCLLARCAIACAEADATGGARWIAEARRRVASLRGVPERWARALATLHGAGVLACEGAREAAIAQLRLAIDELDATGLRAFAVAAQRHLARIVGGDEGAALAASADAYEAAEGIVNGEAFARLHAPGFRRLGRGDWAA